jgi:hypothetical protein
MTEPRYLIMAKPTGLVSDNLQARLEGLGLVGTLGPGEVYRSNWHQSLSDRYWPSEIPDLEAKLTRALAVLVAYPAALSLNRIVREGGRCRVGTIRSSMSCRSNGSSIESSPLRAGGKGDATAIER